jgi:hypothetical protein
VSAALRRRGVRAAAWIALAIAVLATRPAAAQITQEMQDYCDAVRASQPPRQPPVGPPAPPRFDPQRWGWIPVEIWPTTQDPVRQQIARSYGAMRGPDGRYYFPPGTPVWRFETKPTRPPFLPTPAAMAYDPEHFPTNPARCYGCLGGTGDAMRLWILQGKTPASLDHCTLATMAAKGPVYFDPASELGTFDPQDPADPSRRANEVNPYASVVCVPKKELPPPPPRARFCMPRISPNLALNAGRVGGCAPDVINNGMLGYHCGSQFGGGLVGTVTDDPTLVGAGQFAGGTWGAGCLAEGAFTQGTGVYLAPRYSPLYQTSRCVSGGGRLVAQGGRVVVSNPVIGVAAAGVYLDYQGYQYKCAVDDLCSTNDLTGLSDDEFDAMIPYNLGSGSYWRNVGSYYGVCDPLPPPRMVFRGRPSGAGCRGDVRAPSVDPPYEGAEASAGGCATGRAGGGLAFALGSIAVALTVRAHRRRAGKAA